jgi:hypothetical protein
MPERPILFDREALIASLEGDERFEALLAALDEAEEDALKSIARLMMHSHKPVDQRKIDTTRGYFLGARYWLGGRMTTAQLRLAEQAALPTEESDASE